MLRFKNELNGIFPSPNSRAHIRGAFKKIGQSWDFFPTGRPPPLSLGWDKITRKQNWCLFAHAASVIAFKSNAKKTCHPFLCPALRQGWEGVALYLARIASPSWGGDTRHLILRQWSIGRPITLLLGQRQLQQNIMFFPSFPHCNLTIVMQKWELLVLHRAALF